MVLSRRHANSDSSVSGQLSTSVEGGFLQPWEVTSGGAGWTLSPEVDAQHRLSKAGLAQAGLSSINCSALSASEGAEEIWFCVYKHV